MVSIIDDFPIEIVEPMKALTNVTRRRIVLSLLSGDPSSYSQIQNKNSINKGTLNHHLHILVSSGLIRNFSVNSPGDPYNSYYALTNFGRRFIEGICYPLEQHIQTVTALATTNYDQLLLSDYNQVSGANYNPVVLPTVYARASTSEGEENQKETIRPTIRVRS